MKNQLLTKFHCSYEFSIRMPFFAIINRAWADNASSNFGRAAVEGAALQRGMVVEGRSRPDREEECRSMGRDSGCTKRMGRRRRGRRRRTIPTKGLFRGKGLDFPCQKMPEEVVAESAGNRKPANWRANRAESGR